MFLLYTAVNFAGMYTKYLTDRSQRKAFLETHRSTEARFRTQKENEQQEKLLLSGKSFFCCLLSLNYFCIILFLSCSALCHEAQLFIAIIFLSNYYLLTRTFDSKVYIILKLFCFVLYSLNLICSKLSFTNKIKCS